MSPGRSMLLTVPSNLDMHHLKTPVDDITLPSARNVAFQMPCSLPWVSLPHNPSKGSESEPMLTKFD
jgi:hypothetical protein